MNRPLAPDGKKVLQGLNSYYVDVTRLIEHYKTGRFCGCIHFRAYQAEAAIYFDQDHVLSGTYRNKQTVLTGREAIEALAEAARGLNFTIDILELPDTDVYFWANLDETEDVYRDLSAEFTDLDGLIAKMESEALTGYIEVDLGKGRGGGHLFFQAGEFLAGACVQGQGEPRYTPKAREVLTEASRATGAVFHVRRIAMHRKDIGQDDDGTIPPRIFTMLEELLRQLEEVMSARLRGRESFDTLLKRKFLAKSERYDFLDPFLGEFTYADRKIVFTGRASGDKLARAVCEAVFELAGELGLGADLVRNLDNWLRYYERELAKIGLKPGA